MPTREPIPRQRGVWTASAVAALGVVLVAAGLYAPLVAYFAGVSASSVGVVPFPVVGTVAVTLVAAAVVVALLACAVTRRRSAAAWVAGGAAVVVAIVASLVPPALVVAASVDRVSEIGPFLADLWRRVAG
ncbi:MFS transporter permease [Microbacterium sp. NPDC091313]